MSTGSIHVKTRADRLTERQAQVLNAIREHIATRGQVPSRRDLCVAMGLKYQAAVDSHLHALERKGWLVIDRGRARGIELVERDTPIVLPEELPFVAAGTPIEASEGDVQPQMQTMQRLWTKFNGTPNYFLEVRGDSMDRTGIRNGDLVAVQQTPDVQEGDLVIARVGTEITMKRFHRAKHRIELRPESTNPEHKTITVERDTDCEIVGVVVGAVIGMRHDKSSDSDE